jgi:hypothetical protein
MLDRVVNRFLRDAKDMQRRILASDWNRAWADECAIDSIEARG